MMILRNANERWQSNLGWLDADHTFGFEGHYDKDWMGFRNLRIINDDLVMPGHGFGFHPHKNLEIITWVLSGAVEHQDSMGSLESQRAAWLQVAEGEIVFNGKELAAGDGAALEKESKLQISAVRQSQILLFDLN